MDKITEENRLLHQRLQDMEARLRSPMADTPSHLHPPLRAHISKRDTKSFLLHWIPNPLNEQRSILGYRIYIDDVPKGSIESGKFEAIIDCIRDEGEYRIKLRTYDEHGESDDSNVVVARFRRQQSPVSETESLYRTQSDRIRDSRSPSKATRAPLRHAQSQDNLVTRPADEHQAPIIMSSQRDRLELRPLLSSVGHPWQAQAEALTTPEEKKVTLTRISLPSCRCCFRPCATT